MRAPARPHRCFEVHEASQVGEVRRVAVQWAASEGFDDTLCGRIALIATELGTNLVRHARQGQMLVGLVRMDDGASALEVIALDRGPGVADWSRCLADGYSTGGTSGTGLGAVRRLSDVFDAYSVLSIGTAILSRVKARARMAGGGERPAADAALDAAPDTPPDTEMGAVAIAAPGETECGDAWSCHAQAGRTAVLVADGLGHGPDAARAAAVGCEVFDTMPFQTPGGTLDRMHAAMRSTRGGAVFIAHLDTQANEITYCGAGNIAGRVVSGLEDRSLISQHGTAGVQIRRSVDTRMPWPPHALLVLHSDGLATRWNLDAAPGLLQHHPTLVAAWLVRDHTRGRDDVTVVVIKRRSP